MPTTTASAMKTASAVASMSFLLLFLASAATISDAFQVPQLRSSASHRRLSSGMTKTTLFVSSSTPPSSQSKTSSSASKSSSLPKSAIEFTDPCTGCQVVLLGCFHGSRSSAEDVKQVLKVKTDVIALELCAARFADLTKFMEQQYQDTQPWMVRFVKMVSTTVSKKGLGTGVAAAVLASFSGLQTALTGSTPGLEFSTAVEEGQGIDIVLADQVVDETLRKIGSIPTLALEQLGRMDTWKDDSDALIRAIFGDTGDQNDIPQVQLGPTLVRSSASIQDLFRMTVPPFVLLQSSVLLASSVVSWSMGGPFEPIWGDDADVMLTMGSMEYLGDLLFHAIASISILMAGYVGVALPASRVVLSERDDILTRGIRAACQRAGPGGRVVAVLGLLHVNGIAHRMLSESSEEQ